VKAKVTASTELTPAMRQQFEKLVLNMTKGNQVELSTAIDESLIGGYVLQIGDRQIDDSVKSRLERLEEEFLK
jgi:F-type H+-transporting ATPase subunit delta